MGRGALHTTWEDADAGKRANGTGAHLGPSPSFHFLLKLPAATFRSSRERTWNVWNDGGVSVDVIWSSTPEGITPRPCRLGKPHSPTGPWREGEILPAPNALRATRQGPDFRGRIAPLASYFASPLRRRGRTPRNAARCRACARAIRTVGGDKMHSNVIPSGAKMVASDAKYMHCRYGPPGYVWISVSNLMGLQVSWYRLGAYNRRGPAGAGKRLAPASTILRPSS